VTDENTGALIVATPAKDDPVTQYVEDPHITVLWFGSAAELQSENSESLIVPGIEQALTEVTGRYTDFDVKVSGVGLLGPDKASVLLIESAELVEIRAELCASSDVERAWLQAEHQFPWWVPHLTVGYSGRIPEHPPESFHVDALALWMGDERAERRLLNLARPTLASVIPPVDCPEDLSVCLRYADTHPDARWYAAKRALAFGMTDHVPGSWMADA
jgi:2'-5' RNA ligase